MTRLDQTEVWKYKTEPEVVQEEVVPTWRRLWSEIDGEACHIIGMAVEHDQLVYICRKTTAKDMWDSLLGTHEVESMNTMIMQTMCSLKLPARRQSPATTKAVDGDAQPFGSGIWEFDEELCIDNEQFMLQMTESSVFPEQQTQQEDYGTINYGWRNWWSRSTTFSLLKEIFQRSSS